MLKYLLCLKYLRKRKIVFLSIIEVALSCALLIVVGSMFTGYINAIQRGASEFMGDVVLNPKVRLPHYQGLIEQLSSHEDIEAATAVLSSQGLIHLGGGNVRAVSIWGIDPVSRAKVTNFSETLLANKGEEMPTFEVEPNSSRGGGFVSIGIIDEPNHLTDRYDFEKARDMIGKTVILTTGAIEYLSGGSTLGGGDGADGDKFSRKTIPFKVSDIVFNGVNQLDSQYVFLPIDTLSEELYDRAGFATMIHIRGRAGNEPEQLVSTVREIYRDFASVQLGWSNTVISLAQIQSSTQMQQAHTSELRKQMGILMIIFGLVSASVVLLIFCIFYMIVITRQKDIAVIKSCGTSGVSVMQLFLTYGILVGTAGAAVGVVIGVLFTHYVNTIEELIRVIFGLKLWDSSVYFFTKIPNQVNWNTVFWVVVLAIIASAMGALIPAVSAALVRPVKILRYE